MTSRLIDTTNLEAKNIVMTPFFSFNANSTAAFAGDEAALQAVLSLCTFEQLLYTSSCTYDNMKQLLRSRYCVSCAHLTSEAAAVPAALTLHLKELLCQLCSPYI